MIRMIRMTCTTANQPSPSIQSIQRTARVCVLASVCVAVFGCASARFNLTDSERPVNAVPASEARHANFFSGFGQQHTIDAATVCGGANKVASVEVEQSFVDALIATVTLGIYTPLSARVYCK